MESESTAERRLTTVMNGWDGHGLFRGSAALQVDEESMQDLACNLRADTSQHINHDTSWCLSIP